MAPAPRALLENVLDHAGVLRVQADHRFVNDKDFRVVQQGRDDGDALPGAVGEALDRLVDERFEVEARNQFAAGLLNAALAHLKNLAGEAKKFPRRQLVVEERKIRHVGQAAAGFAGDRSARQSRPRAPCRRWV